MLKLAIKASQITNLTDARYFAAREVHWLGFNLDSGTENAIPPQQISAIKEWVEGPKIVGEFGLQSAREIKMICDYLELDAIQIGMFADTEAIHELLDIPIMKEIVMENQDLAGLQALVESLSGKVEIFIIDLMKNNILWKELSPRAVALLKSLCSKYKLLFSINLTLSEIPDFIELIQPYGLVLLGDEEEKVGYKSFDQLDEILDFLELEE